jgi:hypothetical protein
MAQAINAGTRIDAIMMSSVAEAAPRGARQGLA